MEREFYILEYNLEELKQEVDKRMKVVIPPTISKAMQRGQYPFFHYQ